jgi:PKD repeat protein
MTVTFSDLSTGAPTNWLWDFGDGSTTNSTIRNPVHRYATNGSYNISLIVSDADGNNETARIRYINVGMRDKIGVYRNYTHGYYLDANGNGTWQVPNNATNDTQFLSFAHYNNVSVSGDWNGDGRTEIGAFRNTSGGTKWLLDLDGDGELDAGEGPFTFLNGDYLPVTGDWNGDGKTEIGLFRNSTARFFLDMNGDRVWNEPPDVRVLYGSPIDLPVSGDWDNDGISEIGVFRNATHSWYLDLNSDQTLDPEEGPFIFGATTDLPATGDWNGDGRTEIGIFRPTAGRFILDYDNNRNQSPAASDNNTVFVVGNYSVSGRW